MARKSMAAEPYELELDPATTALLIIDMQRDFVMPGGFGEALGNDVTPLQATVAPTGRARGRAQDGNAGDPHARRASAPT